MDANVGIGPLGHGNIRRKQGAGIGSDQRHCAGLGDWSTARRRQYPPPGARPVLVCFRGFAWRLVVEVARANAGANAVVAETLFLDVTSGAEGFAAAGLLPDTADVVLMNPPFNDASRHRASPDKAREVAHVAAAEPLEEWVHASRRCLKSGGTLVMIWRADAIAEVLAALNRGFGSLMIQPVHGDAASAAIRVLVRATKGGRAPTRLLASLVLNDKAGRPTPEANAILAGEGQLPLAIP